MELQGDASRDHFWLSYLIFDPKLDFGHLGYEALSINTLSFDPVPEFFNIG